MEDKIDVYGIGDLSLVLNFRVDPDEFDALEIGKGKTEKINLDIRDKILRNIEGKRESISISGYTLTVLNTLSSLGVNTGMTSKLGMDEFGMVVQREISKTRIDASFKIGFGCTDSCIRLTSPEGTETKMIHKGISKNISYQEVDVMKIKESRLILIEGTILDNVNRVRVTRFLTRIAKENKSKIVFDMNSVENLIKNKDIFWEMIATSDILITSYDQAYLLTEENTIDKQIEKMQYKGSTLIIKSKDCFHFKDDDEYFYVERMRKGSKRSDQYFTAGTIFGTISEYSMKYTGIIASYMHSKEEIDDNILDELHKIL